MPNTHRLEPGNKVDLVALPASGKDFYPAGKETAVAEFKTLRDEFIELQRRLYAEGKQKLLIVFQAMDAGGKDGTIRNVLRGVNPQGVRVHSFKVPSKIELVTSVRSCPGFMMLRSKSGLSSNNSSTWSSICRCGPVTQTFASKRGSACNASARGAIFIASGRVPKTQSVFKVI